ncbi:MAG: hypothetical protein RL070_2029 [Bacteroidota bacterium]|jgi:hypothetical protein|nr:hypothetical protein [Chitinophagia bacterium]
MHKLKFTTAEHLRDFYLEQGFFALYDCSVEYGDVEIQHYSLLRSGEKISPDCLGQNIIDMLEEDVNIILEKFLKTGTVRIHPNNFYIS